PVAPAVRASSAIPTVLPPVPLRDRLLIDGGIIDNFGVHEAVRRGARSIVLIDASTSEIEEPPGGLGEIIDRMTLVSQVHQRRRPRGAAVTCHAPRVAWGAGRCGRVAPPSAPRRRWRPAARGRRAPSPCAPPGRTSRLPSVSW